MSSSHPTTHFSFTDAVRGMNEMYKLPVLTRPGIVIDTEKTPLQNKQATVAKLEKFRDILAEELDEIDEIIGDVNEAKLEIVDILTKFADLLVDIQVYCESEGLKYGIPMDHIRTLVMASNQSKLGDDGLPIYDERGKFLKGPNYWKPEPAIRAVLAYAQENGNHTIPPVIDEVAIPQEVTAVIDAGGKDPSAA